MLLLGGNAFDAAVAAGFASVVAEPSLSSLGGGGFLTAHVAEEKRDILFDFFVNTPGLNGETDIKPEMTPVDIKFPQCTQVFHTGLASAAVPGMLKGMLHVCRRLCTLPLKTILGPAVRYLEEGVELSETHEVFLSLLKPIFTSTDYGREIYLKNGRYVKAHDRIFNPLLKEFYQGIADNGCDIYSGKTALKIVDEMRANNGLVTMDDLEAYEVIEREPLRIPYRNREILINPPPSAGGVMLALGLKLLNNIDIAKLPDCSGEYYITLIELMKVMHDLKSRGNGMSMKYLADSEISPLLKPFIRNVAEKTFISTKGTTHMSVIDEKGNAASMTISNGSGSGCFIPGTGIMLNNMMGEDDLHPEGFFSSTPGIRVSSMMLPTIILKNGSVENVLGSGGSKRIRTAILQVLINLIDHSCSLKEAVEKSRVHLEDEIVQAEPEIPDEAVHQLRRHYTVNRWNEKNLYFGGVHCVNSEMDGWGDSRRGGSFLTLS
jgi:gamma-glutamyltranspeptidase/glutathione hydrolase